MKKVVKKTSVSISAFKSVTLPQSRLLTISKKSVFISTAFLSMPIIAHASSQWLENLNERSIERKSEGAISESSIQKGPIVYEWRISPVLGINQWSFEQNGNVSYRNLSFAGGASASIFFPQPNLGFDAESVMSLVPISGSWKDGNGRLFTSAFGFRRPMNVPAFDGYTIVPGLEFHYSNSFVTDRRFGFTNIASIGPALEVSKTFRSGLSKIRLKSALLPVAAQGVAFGLPNIEYTVGLSYEQLPNPDHASSLGFSFNMGYDKITANVSSDSIRSQNFISSFSLLY